MLTTLKNKKLYSKSFKCDFLLREVSFLVYLISSSGIDFVPSKIGTMFYWETPKSVTKMMSFMGLIAYYKSFIEGFSKFALSLTQLTHKG